MVKLVSDNEKDAEQTESVLPAVTIFTTPQTTGFEEDKFCGKIYKAKGACAKQSELIAWKDAWAARLKKRRESVISNAKKLAESTDKFQKVIDLLKNDSVKTTLKEKSRANLPEEKREPRTAEEVAKEREAATTATSGIADEAAAVTNLLTDVNAGIAMTDPLKKKEAWFSLGFKIKTITEKFALSASKYIDFFLKLKPIMDMNTTSFNFSALKTHLDTWANFKATKDAAATTLPPKIVNNVETKSGVEIAAPVFQDKKVTDSDITKWEKDLSESTDATKKQDLAKKGEEAQKFSDACFKKLAWVRGNALCLRTSGAANDFYDAATKRYLISKSICKEVIPWCAPFNLWVAKTQKSISALMNVKNSLSTTKPDPKATDASLDDTKIADLETCAKDKTACENNAALIDKLCADLTLSGENKKAEGDNRSMRYGQKAVEETDKGTIKAPAPKRVLAEAESDDGEGGVSPVADASGANLVTDFESGDTTAKNAAVNASISNSSQLYSIAFYALIGFLALY